MTGVRLFSAVPRRVLATLACAVLPVVAHAQRPPVQREADSDVRRRALIELWDAIPGSEEPRSGATFAAWLREQPRMAAISVPVPVPGVWSSIGPLGFYGDNGFFGSLPQLDAGRVPTVAFHPTERNTLFVGTAAGGVWKSTNEGASWVPLTDGQCSLVIGNLAIDPVTPNIIYAGTGEPSEATYGCGVLRSTDGGTSWTNIATAPFVVGTAVPSVFYGLLVDRASAGSASTTTLVAATNTGIYRSVNSGQAWTLVSPALTFSDIVQHPTNPNIMYAARRGVSGSTTPGGLWRSQDRGATWAALSAFPADSVGRIEIAVSRAKPGSVWLLASAPNSTFGGLYRWDDSTATRTTLAASGVNAPPAVANRNNFGGQGNYDLMIALDQANPDNIFVGGVRAYRSKDGGTTFQEIAMNIHCDWHVILVDPSDARRVLAGSDGGAFLSRDGGDAFQSINAGLATTLHYAGLSLHPTDPTGILTGMQDNGTIIARNGMTQWNGVFGGDGAFTAINPNTPTTYYVSSQNGNLVRANALTGSLVTVTNGIPSSTTERRAFIAPFVVDATRPTRLYFGGARLFRTENEGALWNAITTDLTRGTGTISAIALAPSDSNTIYVGTSDANVKVSRDFGVTWNGTSATLPSRAVGDFAVDRQDAAKAVVTFTSSGTGHVYLTRDGGESWTNITGTLPDVATQAAAWGPNGRLFIGNMYGVYSSPDLGVTWTRESGVPWIRVTDLVYNETTKRLVAATYGRGIWSYDFNTASAVRRGDVNGDGVVNAADALIIQQALVGLSVQPANTVFPNGDANCDGALTILDALHVLRFAVGDAPVGSCVGTVR